MQGEKSKMKLNYYVTKDYEALSQQSAQVILETLKKYPEGLYCFAGGDTPIRTLEILVEKAKENQVDLSKASFIELDEWMGIDKENTGSCFYYLNEHFWKPAAISSEHIHIFDSKAENMTDELKKADDFIQQKGGLTLCLLGVGVNGHLGFNEPGTLIENQAQLVPLSETTKKVGEKYFSSHKVTSEMGITLGLGQLLDAKVFMVQASGHKKHAAIHQVLKGVATSQWPVTYLWHHENPILIIDEDVVKE